MDNIYQTSDGDLVAYLNYDKVKTKLVRYENGSVTFIFDLTPEVNKKIESYYSDSTSVAPRLYSEHIKRIRVIISTTKRNAEREVQR